MLYDQQVDQTAKNPPVDEAYEMKPDTSGLLTEKVKRKYQPGVGSLDWAANNMRPDLAHAMSVLSSKSSMPNQANFQSMIQGIEYVQSTIS